MYQKIISITGLNHIHNGFKYELGLNLDPKPFRAEGSCVAGGLYFFKKITDVIRWLSYGVYLYTVEVPEDHQYVLDPEGGKYRASGLILSNPRDLRKVDTWVYLIEHGIDIHKGDDEALRWSARNGHLDIVKYLVENGADIHAKYGEALRNASRYGHLDVVKYLVEKGADIHTCDDHALRWAVQKGHLDIVKYLVEKGADIHADGDAALCAAQKGHLEVVKYLVSAGADIHARGDAALRWSAYL